MVKRILFCFQHDLILQWWRWRQCDSRLLSVRSLNSYDGDGEGVVR